MNDAILPTRGSDRAAGSDLYAVQRVSILPHQRAIVPTGISIAIDNYARIAPRSGIAIHHGIDVLAGVIDADYRGQVGVVLINHGDTPFEIQPGDRIAQLILEYIALPLFVEVDKLDDTDRGIGGFGSTGK